MMRVLSWCLLDKPVGRPDGSWMHQEFVPRMIELISLVYLGAYPFYTLCILVDIS